MSKSEEWEQFSAYRPMIEDAKRVERNRIINVIRKMRIDNYREESFIGYYTGWDMGLHDVIDVLEGEEQ